MEAPSVGGVEKSALGSWHVAAACCLGLFSKLVPLTAESRETSCLQHVSWTGFLELALFLRGRCMLGASRKSHVAAGTDAPNHEGLKTFLRLADA